jgi:uncharacterized lipoprotein YmbA
MAVLQIIGNQRLRVPDVCKAPQLVVLYEDGNVCFWNQKDWSLTYHLQTYQSLTKIVFEASSRYFAGRNSDGGVSVWSMKHPQPKEEWALNFSSVMMIEPS